MKKLILLFTILCAGALNAMEPEQKMGAFGELPKELHPEIVKKALESSNTPKKAVKAITVASALQGVKYDNLEDFTRLVHRVAKKFKVPVNIIATEFGTPTAKTYITLSENLGNAVKNGQTKEVEQLINQGADVHFLVNNNTILEFALGNISENTVKIVKILLDHGANPYAQAPGGRGESLGDLIEEDEFLDWYSVDESQSENYEVKQSVFPQVRKLLEDAMKNYESYSDPYSPEENISGEGCNLEEAIIDKFFAANINHHIIATF